MMRIAGFVTGAIVAVIGMLLLFGVPRISDDHGVSQGVAAAPPPASVGDPPPVDSANEQDGTSASAAARAEADDTTGPPTTAQEPIEEPPGAAPTALANEPTAAVPDVAAPAPGVAAPAIGVGDATPPADLQWHAFWSPFASRIAADGFVGRLEAVTGFDYRVVRVDTGVYEVAFAYADDAEREARRRAIEVATGLELPGS